MTVARKLKATLPGPLAAEALCVSQVLAIGGTLARLRQHLGGYLTAFDCFWPATLVVGMQPYFSVEPPDSQVWRGSDGRESLNPVVPMISPLYPRLFLLL